MFMDRSCPARAGLIPPIGPMAATSGPQGHIAQKAPIARLPEDTPG